MGPKAEVQGRRHPTCCMGSRMQPAPHLERDERAEGCVPKLPPLELFLVARVSVAAQRDLQRVHLRNQHTPRTP